MAEEEPSEINNPKNTLTPLKYRGIASWQIGENYDEGKRINKNAKQVKRWFRPIGIEAMEDQLATFDFGGEEL